MGSSPGFLIVCLIMVSFSVVGQRTETAVYLSNANNRLVFEVENDLLFQSDNYYTAGIAFSYTNRKLRNTPAQLILNTKRSGIHTFSGFGIQQRIFTPHSISDPYGIENDRPYSAYLLASNYAVLINTGKNLRMANEIGLGMLGRSAGGEEVQTFIHELIGSDIPIGWNEQLSNTFVFDYQFRIEKGFFGDWTAQHIIPFAEVQVGTLMDRINIGLMSKFGNLNNRLKGLGAENASKEKLIWEAVVEANFHGVFYDATLEGGLLNNDASALSRQETVSRQYQLRMGVNLYYKNLSFRYMAKFNSNSFHAGGTDRYGSLNIGVAF